MTHPTNLDRLPETIVRFLAEWSVRAQGVIADAAAGDYLGGVVPTFVCCRLDGTHVFRFFKDCTEAMLRAELIALLPQLTKILVFSLATAIKITVDTEAELSTEEILQFAHGDNRYEATREEVLILRYVSAIEHVTLIQPYVVNEDTLVWQGAIEVLASRFDPTLAHTDPILSNLPWPSASGNN